MYTEYWGLTCAPFENTPDPRFFYASAQHQEGLARLLYVVEERKGAGLLTGVFGCGKTLLARSMMGQVSAKRYQVAYLANPLMSGLEVLRAIAQKLNVPNLPDRRSDILIDELLASIERVLKDNQRDGKETLVIIDEAHVIRDEEVLEQLRLLLNFQLEDRFLLTLLLMGQPELKELIERHKPLAQRICIGYHLGPLSAEETTEYIHHRLRMAGSQREDLFNDGAVRSCFEASGGIPRRINQLADLALLTGMGKQASHVDETMMQDVIQSVGVEA